MAETEVPQSNSITTPGGADDALPATSDELREKIIATLKTCYDPEVPVNIYELGLIYRVDVQPGGAVVVRMTLTSPNCPVAESLPRDVEGKIRALPGVTDVKIDLVWEPPWTKDMMSDAAKLQLNLM